MESKQQLLNRLRSVEGHVRSVERMVDEDVYCIDILHQTRAIQRALERFNHLILQRHLNTCVTTAIRNDDPDERERVIGELLQVFDASTKV
jgi:DNA-binding FrmR family transcriptional regulator